MRKRLQIALTGSSVATTSFSLTSSLRAAQAADGASEKITATDERGRKIYVNESAPAKARRAETTDSPRRKLMYWSSKENRRKAVRAGNAATMREARSAPAEGSEFLGRESSQSATVRIV